MINWLKENKVLIISFLILLIFLTILWVSYALFGHQVIRAMDEGKGQNIYPLEFYFAKFTRRFNYLLGFLFVSFCIGIGCFSKQTNRFLNYKNILALSFNFVAILIFLHIMVKLCNRFIKFDCPSYWPISIFEPQPAKWIHLLVAIVVLGIFRFVIKYLARIKYKIPYIILAAIILILGTNLIQGGYGYVKPIIGRGEEGIQFYHDARKIKDIHYFLSHFEQEQPSLIHRHASTHPPGAVLTIYFLLKTLGRIGLVSITMAIISVSLSIFFLYKLLLSEFSDLLSKYISFLFILIPSIQIYFLATVDALFAAFLLGAIYFFMHPKQSISIIGSLVFIFLASFLGFTFIFMLPIMFGFDILKRKNIWRSSLVILGLGIIYIIFYIFFGFNYLNSFRIASLLENPERFILISEPLSYIFTRIEGILEILLFFGPFLLVMMLKGLSIMKRLKPNLCTLTYLTLFTLSGMFLGGVFTSGETARLCLFIYPYLIIPVAAYIEENNFSSVDKNVLLHLVFAQTLFMQILGDYFW